MRYLIPLLFVIGATQGLQAQLQPAEALRGIPDHAELVVATGPLRTLALRVSRWDAILDLRMAQLRDPFETFRAISGLREGLDASRGITMVFSRLALQLDAQGRPAGVSRRGAVGIPILSIKTFAGNFGLEEVAPETVVEIQYNGAPMLLAFSKDRAILGDDRAIVLSMAQAKDESWMQRVGMLGQAALARQDITLLFNLASHRKEVLASIDQWRVARQKKMDQWIWDATHELFTQAQTLIVGIDLDGESVVCNVGMRFSKDTKIAGYFENPPAQAPALDRLRAGPFLVAATFVTDGLPLAAWREALLARLPAEDPVVMQWRALTLPLALKVKSASFLEPPRDRPNEASVVYGVDDPIVFVTEYERGLKAMASQDIAPGVGYRVHWLPGVYNVAGHAVHRYALRLRLSPKRVAAMSPVEREYYSADMGRSVAPTRGAAMMSPAREPDQLQQALSAATGRGLFETFPEVASARRRWLPYRFAEAYVDLAAVTPYAGQNGQHPVCALSASKADGTLMMQLLAPRAMVQAMIQRWREAAQIAPANPSR